MEIETKIPGEGAKERGLGKGPSKGMMGWKWQCHHHHQGEGV